MIPEHGHVSPEFQEQNKFAFKSLKLITFNPMKDILAENLTIEYELLREKETLTALWNFDLLIQSGEFVVIVGPSGCGKTTFINSVVGLVKPTSGKLLCGGEPILGTGPGRVMVFQEYALMPWRTVQKNVEFGLELQGLLNSNTRKNISKYIDLVGLNGFVESLPHELSGGMQQRVGLARALATEPEVLTLDEPFGALDAMTREVMQAEFEKILERTKQTVIFITHSIDEAIAMGDRIVVMTAGPGRIKTIINNEIPRPRYELEIRKHPLYHPMREQIWDLLKSEQEIQMQQEVT
ncbi:MAG: ABC transporter ATP-binding protein [Candidatus Marinimicrobia bacterium]|jgi:NitT/TauT family transport system ATP-binding protein|nr:ABC transporter ATP-binding protein [Candidatus Neomarinimicrobiota bacterium]|tara:strand:- start:284 stop:1168 length:885 start_codon:yes stop_codon:yes gene_type:complete